MATLDQSLPSIIADIGSGNLSLQGLEMDEDDTDILDSPADESSLLTPDQSSYEKQRANLAAYLDALPYKCDSLQEMQQRLEHIIEKLLICAESKNWSVLTTWDAMLQWQVPNPFSCHHISYPAQLATVALPYSNLYSRQAC
jgi:proteasome activator subunit 4